MDTINYELTRLVKAPLRGHTTDAGIDFFIPSDHDSITLSIGDSVLIPSGVKMEVPEGYMLTAFNKSGVASKLGLVVGAQVVDHGYAGEIHINMHKVTGEPITLMPGQKIVQFIMTKIETPEPVQVETIYAEGSNSERGASGFGSTGE